MDFRIGENVEHIHKHFCGTVHAVAKNLIKVAFLGPKPKFKEPNQVIIMNCKPDELRKIR